MVLALVVIGTTTAVNHEVSKRLATIPLPTTTSTQLTTTTLVARPATPRHRGAANTIVAAATVDQTTTTTTEVVAQDVPKSAYDIITKLDALPVRDEHTLGYGRYRFGAWRDDDGDGCTSNYDVLIDQGKDVVSRKNPCDIVSGEWRSPYDAAAINDPAAIVVDHVVGLYEAWKSGAYNWTDSDRNDYLNDMKIVNAILAVSKTSQQNKAGRDPKDWLPSNQAFRCPYLQTWVDVKTKWNLSVDAGERESIAAAALNC
ncbi:MAG: hypothetical protein QOK28_2281 [Actinomycetota bacterium]